MAIIRSLSLEPPDYTRSHKRKQGEEIARGREGYYSPVALDERADLHYHIKEDEPQGGDEVPSKKP